MTSTSPAQQPATPNSFKNNPITPFHHHNAMAPTEDATPQRIRSHPTGMKILSFPFYLCCFANANANAPSILFNSKDPSAALPTAAKLKTEEPLNPLLYKTATTPTSQTTTPITTPTIPPTISYPTINTPKAQVKQDVLAKTYFNLFTPANVKVPTPTSRNNTSITTPCLRSNNFDNTHDAVVGACLTLVTACIAYIAGEKKTMKNITHYQRIAATTHNQMTDLATPNQLQLPLPTLPPPYTPN